MQKSYKALILDVDGTIISKYNALPSTAVTTAIAKASKKLHVGLATSRPFFMLPHLIAHLNLSGPSIINGGGRIVDACTQKVLWEQPLLTTDLPKIYELANAQNLTFLINDDGQDYACTTDYKPHKPLHIWLHELSEEQADTFITKATHIPTISVNKVPSWTKGKVDALISHVGATKQHGIMEVAKFLGIETKDMIGVGDGYNDFPLLLSCGLKIAMGNAVTDLKAIADYVAPSVEEDGVADIIEKFVLQ